MGHFWTVEEKRKKKRKKGKHERLYLMFYRCIIPLSKRWIPEIVAQMKQERRSFRLSSDSDQLFNLLHLVTIVMKVDSRRRIRPRGRGTVGRTTDFENTFRTPLCSQFVSGSEMTSGSFIIR